MLNIEIDQGTDREVEFVKTGDTGQPVDVTGYRAKLQVRKTVGETPAKITLTQDDGIAIDGAEGLFTAAFLPADTANLESGRYLYDIYTVDTDDKTEKLESGYFTIIAAITRDIS